MQQLHQLHCVDYVKALKYQAKDKGITNMLETVRTYSNSLQFHFFLIHYPFLEHIQSSSKLSTVKNDV